MVLDLARDLLPFYGMSDAKRLKNREKRTVTHLEFAASESAALEPTAWDRWIDEVERLAKGHDIGRDEPGNIDGDQDGDGFSLDGAFESFEAGKSPAGYLLGVQREIGWREHAALTEGKL